MYDPYYETKVMPSWGRNPIGCVFGYLLIFIGLSMMTFSVSDLAAGAPPYTGSAWQENSIWPTIGKGCWVGALLIGTGIVGIISKRQRTLISMFVFCGLTWITAVLSLYVIISSILHIQPYMDQNFASNQNRQNYQNIEVAMNSLLIAAGSFGFIVSLLSALCTCVAANCCKNGRNDAPHYPYPYPQHDYSKRPFSGPFGFDGPYGTHYVR